MEIRIDTPPNTDTWRSTWSTVGLALFFCICLGPIGWMVASSLPALLAHPDVFVDLAIPTGRRLTLFLASVSHSATVAAVGMVISTLIALVCWEFGVRRTRWLRAAIFALAPLPPYVHALAWMAILPLGGRSASLLVQVMALLPIAAALAIAGFESLDPSGIDAARLVRPDASAFFRVALPLAAPSILAGAGLLMVLSLAEYSIPSLFSVDVYSLEVFAEFSATNDPVRALAIALPLVVSTTIVLAASQNALRCAASTGSDLRPAWSTRARWNASLRIALGVAAFALAAQALVPAIRLVVEVGSLGGLLASGSAAGRDLATSLAIATAVAALSLPIGLGVASRLAAGGRGWWLAATAPLALPAPLVGIALVGVFNNAWLAPFADGLAPPILASLARFAPIAAIVLAARLLRLDPAMVDAARVFQASGVHGLVRVRLPLLAPGLTAAFLIVFALALGELGATLVVLPPGYSTLSVRIYNFLHYGASDQVAGLCLIVAAMALLAGIVAVARPQRLGR